MCTAGRALKVNSQRERVSIDWQVSATFDFRSAPPIRPTQNKLGEKKRVVANTKTHGFKRERNNFVSGKENWNVSVVKKNVWGSLLFVWSFDSRRRPNWRGSTIKREEISWGFFNKQLWFVYMFKSRVGWRSPLPSNRWASLKGSINTCRVDQSKTTAETGWIRSVRGEVGNARDNGHKIDSNISPPLYQSPFLYHLTTHTQKKIYVLNPFVINAHTVIIRQPLQRPRRPLQNLPRILWFKYLPMNFVCN